MLKSVVQGYEPPPFFFKQQSDDDVRLVVWTPDLSQLKRLVYATLETFPNEVEVLLKLHELDDEGEERWARYYQQTTLHKVQEAIRSNEEYVFQDGFHQLCIKRPDNGEFIALDDHDVLFIYSGEEIFQNLCREAGFEERMDRLISEVEHWHHGPKDAEKLRDKFIKVLDLEAVS